MDRSTALSNVGCLAGEQTAAVGSLSDSIVYNSSPSIERLASLRASTLEVELALSEPNVRVIQHRALRALRLLLTEPALRE